MYSPYIQKNVKEKRLFNETAKPLCNKQAYPSPCCPYLWRVMKGDKYDHPVTMLM